MFNAFNDLIANRPQLMLRSTLKIGPARAPAILVHASDRVWIVSNAGTHGV